MCKLAARLRLAGQSNRLNAMKNVLAVLALLLVAVTVLPLLRVDYWWIRIFDFPRGQIALVGVVLAILYVVLWSSLRASEIILLVLLVLAVGVQAIILFPYSVLMPKQVATATFDSPDNRLSLLVVNVMMDNRQSQALLKIVEDYNPDIILTMETDDWWERALRPLEQAYPHTLKHPLDNTYGMLVHSRLALIDPDIRFILKDDIPSMHMQVVLPSDERVFVHFVHPDPPNPKYAIDTTKRDAELLIIGREVDQRDVPTLIAGDLNDVPWSSTTRLFKRASGLLDPRVGRGMYNTFDARFPVLRWPLDHVLMSRHFKLVQLEVGPAWGSDHFPLFITMQLTPEARNEQTDTDTSASQAAQVSEKIEEGRQQRDD